MKRRYLHRNDWQRIIRKDYQEMKINDENFKGYISLIQMHEVAKPLITKHLDKEICIVDNRYSWLQQLPFNENFAITTMFNQDGEIVQWYIDIIYESGVENGIPYMDDLFLDIIVFPTGEVIQKDKDELAWALASNLITQQQYERAYQVFNQVLAQIEEGSFPYFFMSSQHRNKLLNEVIT
ncbi:DUF402 domain-containing protein [Bacillus ndiopicus]|uniref:DUF402 domain-containing protein n=1 Tax=Bacillus ndiopicus TaxID=1347368 RepID=UPI0005A7C7C4|nr:DUF402 domain-containing protein [Bacillus ndiopicus]